MALLQVLVLAAEQQYVRGDDGLDVPAGGSLPVEDIVHWAETVLVVDNFPEAVLVVGIVLVADMADYWRGRRAAEVDVL